jgi:hypothetical protein
MTLKAWNWSKESLLADNGLHFSVVCAVAQNPKKYSDANEVHPVIEPSHTRKRSEIWS